MGVKIKRNMPKIVAKIEAGRQAMVEAVTESVVEYGNIFVPVDQGILEASSLIGTTITDSVDQSGWTDEDKKIYAAASGSRPKEGKAVWDTPYAKKLYYTYEPPKEDKERKSRPNPQASKAWAQKAVDTYKKELDQVAQNAFNEGIKKANKK